MEEIMDHGSWMFINDIEIDEESRCAHLQNSDGLMVLRNKCLFPYDYFEFRKMFESKKALSLGSQIRESAFLFLSFHSLSASAADGTTSTMDL